jgi:hypothetical protein
MSRFFISIFMTLVFTALVGACAMNGSVFTGIACAFAALGWGILTAYVYEDEKP